MKIIIVIFTGFMAAWFFSGPLHHAATGKDYLSTDTESLIWLGGTWIAVSVITWIVLSFADPLRRR